MYINEGNRWYWALYQLTGMDSDGKQAIVIYRDGTQLVEMERLIGE